MPQMKVYWSDEALERFNEIIGYLKLNFSDNDVQKFVKNTLSTIRLISNNPSMGKWSDKLQCSVFVLHPKISILYDIKSGEKMIRIITFWNNMGGFGLFN